MRKPFSFYRSTQTNHDIARRGKTCRSFLADPPSWSHNQKLGCLGLAPVTYLRRELIEIEPAARRISARPIDAALWKEIVTTKIGIPQVMNAVAQDHFLETVTGDNR